MHGIQLTRYSTNLRPPLTSPFSFLIRRLKSLPSRQIKSSPGWMMPHLAAMALAVLMLSPVTIRTVMPARWHLRMASGTLEDKDVCSQKNITILFLTAQSHYGMNKPQEPIQIPTIPKHMLALKSHTSILTLEKVYSLSKGHLNAKCLTSGQMVYSVAEGTHLALDCHCPE